MNSQQGPVCLILGATGKVGNATLRSLAGASNLTLRAAVRNAEGQDKVSPHADEVTHFDFEDPDCYKSALQGVDRLFLLTGYSVDMLHQSKILVDKAAEAGVRFIVHLGTHAPDNTSFKHHAWHQLVERYIEWRGFGFIHLRPAMFMVNILDYAKANKDRPGTLIHYTGETKVAWVDTGDIGKAAAKILEEPHLHSGATYFLDSEALSMGEVADVLQDVTGQGWRFLNQDAATLLPRLQVAGREMTYAESGIAFFAAVASGRAKDVGKIHGSLQNLLGAPPASWREFALRHRGEFLRQE